MRISDWSSDVCSSDLRVGGTWLLGQEIAEAIDGVHAVSDFEAFVAVDHGPDICHGLRAEEGEVRVGGFEKTPAPAKVESRGRNPWQMRSEEHTSELQSLMRISYAVFCLKKKKPATTT